MFKRTDGVMRKDKMDYKSLDDTLERFENCIPLFVALSDVNRQRIVVALAQRDFLNVKEITEVIPLSRPAISHHLKHLRIAGIVDVEKRGTENCYFLTLKTGVQEVRNLLTMIEKTCYLK